MSTKTTKAKALTANQTAVLAEIRKGAGTDAEIGEALSTMKLSAIGTVARSLIKRGELLRLKNGRYAVAGEDGEAVVPEPAAPVGDVTFTKPKGSLAKAYDAAMERQTSAGGAVLEETKKGGYAKSFNVEGCWITTDGSVIVAKDAKDPKTPWTAYRVSEEGVAAIDTYKSSSPPFAMDEVLRISGLAN